MEQSSAAKLQKQPQHGLKRLRLELDAAVELHDYEGLRQLLIALPQALIQVADLERHIRSLFAGAVSLPPLVLAIDGFVLPSHAPVAEVVRDGEIVVIRKAKTISEAFQPQHGLKRLRIELDAAVELHDYKGLRQLLIALPRALTQVADLERHIHSLFAGAVSLPPLVLAVDGFVLPSHAPVAEIVRDGKIVVIRKAKTISEVSEVFREQTCSEESADVAMGGCSQPAAVVTSAEAVYAARHALASRGNMNRRPCRKDADSGPADSDAASSLLEKAKAAALEEANELLRATLKNPNGRH